VVSQRKILVIGATGQQGGAVARLLLQKRHEVYALTRNTESETPKETISQKSRSQAHKRRP